MHDHRTTAISTGILFLVALIFNIAASGIYQPILKAPDYLVTVYPNKTAVTTGVLIDFICAPAMILIPVMMFPLFKMFNERMALGYVAFRLAEGILHIYLAINSLSLINLSQDYLRSPSDASFYHVLGNSIHARIEWATLLYIIVYALGAFLFYYLLYTSKLIPRWLSGWGSFSVVLLLTGALLHLSGMFGAAPLMKVMPFFAPPIALQELVMSVWLIAKGFNPAALVPVPGGSG